MKKFTYLFLASILALSLPAGASKIQQQGIVGTSDCTTRGISNANCLPTDSQIYVGANGINKTLNAAIVAGAIGGGGGGNGTNYLTNSSFESGFNSSWTVTTATGSNDTTNFTDGTQSALLTFSASTGNIAQSIAPSTQLASVNMQASCFVDTTQTGVQLCPTLNGSTTNCQNVPSSGTWAPVTASFIGPANPFTITGSVSSSSTPTCVTSPSSVAGIVAGQSISGTGIPASTTVVAVPGTCSAGQIQMSASATITGTGETITIINQIGLEVLASTSITGTVNVDQCYVGKSVTTSQLSQAQLWGSIKATGCSSWSGTSGSFSNYSATTGCTYVASGNVTAPSTQVPGLQLGNAGPGTYLFVYNGNVGSTSSASTCNYRFSDGTNGSDESAFGSGAATLQGPSLNGQITYTVGQSNPTVQIQNARTSGSGNCVVTGGTTATSNPPFQIDVYYYPSQQQAGYRPDGTPASWSGYSSGVSGGCSTSSTGSYADPSSCTGIGVTQLTAANISCVQAASSAPAITCNLPRSGRYAVTANVVVALSGGGGVAHVMTTDGSNNTVGPGQINDLVVGGIDNFTIPGQYLATAGSNTFKVRLAVNTGSIAIDQGGITGDASIGWTITELDAPAASPYLVGAVGSTTLGRLDVETVNFAGNAGLTSACSTSPCTLSNATPGISSITRTSTGVYVLNFVAGTFTGTPSCKFDVLGNIAGSLVIPTSVAPTSSAVTFETVNSAFSVVDSGATISCTGPH